MGGGWEEGKKRTHSLYVLYIQKEKDSMIIIHSSKVKILVDKNLVKTSFEEKTRPGEGLLICVIYIQKEENSMII